MSDEPWKFFAYTDFIEKLLCYKKILNQLQWPYNCNCSGSSDQKVHKKYGSMA